MHVQLVPQNFELCGPADVDDLFSGARELARGAGIKRGWVWIHANGFQEIRGLDQIVDECPGELHVHVLAEFTGRATELGDAIDRERWDTRFPAFGRRRTGVVRNGEVSDLVLRSSRAITNKSARVIRSFGPRGGGSKEPETPPEGSATASKARKERWILCPMGGELHEKAEFGFFEPVNDRGIPVPVPWDRGPEADLAPHIVVDGEDGVFWRRVDAMEVVLRP